MPILQMWTKPPLAARGRFGLPGGGVVDVGPVIWAPDPTQVEHCTVVSHVTGTAGLDGDYGQAWRHMHSVLEVLAFAELSNSKVVLARIDPDGVALNQPFECRVFPGPPPPVSALHLPTGFPHQTRHDAPMDSGPSEPARTAISWFLRSLRATDPFERAMFLWIALEGLSPPVKEVPRCGRCHKHPLRCEVCGPAPAGHRVIKAIQEHLCSLPGVSKDEIRALYDERSAMVHGRYAPGSDTAGSVGQGVMRLMQITIEAIKRELGWPADEPPMLDGQGGHNVHRVFVSCSLAFRSDEDRRRPLLEVQIDPIRGTIPNRS